MRPHTRRDYVITFAVLAWLICTAIHDRKKPENVATPKAPPLKYGHPMYGVVAEPQICDGHHHCHNMMPSS